MTDYYDESGESSATIETTPNLSLQINKFDEDEYLYGNKRITSVYYLNSNKTVYATIADRNGETFAKGMDLLFSFTGSKWEKVDFFKILFLNLYKLIFLIN